MDPREHDVEHKPPRPVRVAKKPDGAMERGESRREYEREDRRHLRVRG